MNRQYRKTVIAGNWKMNKTPTETKEFMAEFKAMMPKGRWCDVALCVPTSFLLHDILLFFIFRKRFEQTENLINKKMRC